MIWRIQKLRLWLAYKLMPGDLKYIFADMIKAIGCARREDQEIVINVDHNRYNIHLQGKIITESEAK